VKTIGYPERVCQIQQFGPVRRIIRRRRSSSRGREAELEAEVKAEAEAE